MTERIVLASGSETRRKLLQNAGVPFDVFPVALDEEQIKQSMILEGAKPRDIADVLAEQKAKKAARKVLDRFVIGADQVLDFGGRVLSKPETPQGARHQLEMLRGQKHTLLSAAVIYHGQEPVWRHISGVRIYMRNASDAFLDDYIDRNWNSIRTSVGGYRLEEEGIRLISRVEGDYFAVLGLPLTEILDYLMLRGALPG